MTHRVARRYSGSHPRVIHSLGCGRTALGMMVLSIASFTLTSCASDPVKLRAERQAEALQLASEVDQLVAAGQLEEAIDAAEDLLEIDDTSPPVLVAVARAKAALGLRDGEPRTFDDAIRFVDVALAADPDNAKYRMMRANWQYERRYFTMALDDLERVLERDPSRVDAIRIAARCHEGLRQPIGARASWNDLLRLQPNDVEGHLALALLVGAKATTEEKASAQGHLDTALQLAPNDPLTLQTVAHQRLLNDDFEGAETYLKRAVYAAQGVPEREADALFNLGAVAQQQEKFDEARDYYERGVLLTPNDPRLLANLGYVESKLGNDEQARIRLEQAQAAAALQGDEANRPTRRVKELLQGLGVEPDPAAEGSLDDEG